MKDHPLLATDEQLAEILKVDPAQVGRWKQRKSFGPVGYYSARGRKENLYSVTQAKRELTKDRKKENP